MVTDQPPAMQRAIKVRMDLRGGLWCGMRRRMRPGKAKIVAANGLVEAALRGELTEAQARLLAKENAEILALALFAPLTSTALVDRA